MSIKLQLPELTDLKPRIVVIGVGGAGCNAVNNMIAAGLTGVEFVVANTDAQTLAASSAEHRIQLGAKLTEGLGAGSKPEIGQAAAEEAIEEIKAQVTGAHMVFIAAGMGGGTGTGAAAKIAETSQSLGILTVGVVTKPFHFEGRRRMRIAEAGVNDLKAHVDTLIVIPNQNLFRLANEKTTFSEAFILADQVLYSGVACIVDLIIKEGLINLDFADVRTVISGMGSAMMGTGEAAGERRAIVAAEEAIANPLLDDVSLKGARGLLLSITGGSDLTLYEVDEAASRVREEVDADANIIVGATFDETLGDRVRVSIVASGMQSVGHLHTPQRAAGAQAPEFMAGHAEVPGHVASQPAPDAGRPDHSANAISPHGEAIGASDTQSSDDLKRRLSDALQSDAQAQPQAINPFAAQAAHETASASSPPIYNYDDNSAQSTGHVTIEDGLPPLPNTHHYQSHFDDETLGDGAYESAPAFEPAMTEPLPRSSRRMPSVEDFPPHAQIEYRHKQVHSAQNTVHARPAHDGQHGEPPRKRSLLERLRRRASRKGDSLVDNNNLESEQQRQSAPLADDSPDVDGGRGFQQSHSDSRNSNQDADLPMFFGRVSR